MTDPVTFTAATIVTLAFSEFVKFGTGELAKKPGSLVLGVEKMQCGSER